MAQRRPVIGITCYVEDVDRPPWVGQRSAVLPYRYVAQVEAAGGLAVVLPPRPDVDEAMAREVVERLDGLVVAGGADVSAHLYGAAPHPTSQDPRPDRDAWETALVRAAEEVDLPVLGICRGMQVMAVAAGGRIEQHVPDRVGHEAHSPRPGVYSSHHVDPVDGSRLAGLLGDEPLDVPTYHHQAVVPDSLDGTGWAPSAWHEDGTLEAMEDPRSRFRLAVQWHAEEGESPALFAALVSEARSVADGADERGGPPAAR
ncbi:gamma-glutamyl-gamma-aminobutyrate hydrolase family protein [Phycicoccus sonneratiae]|uniref:Gamma-glutamyl-gamma-aminobutyrate hydrolase family protein n=1 Tax=Phycicoccus sonneratiae TaxID=2807628 RepID=A0ABS2CL58_9MICO|nr:gamma-glutamyl-gamma-aminobutyrate hydrolase family protein [Phycicoccus sonneraticus]MBM6400510.1 gamma-glutamyl-gamma-aminobutyrate hydrolase family protein [Phycicoccus sonneraticus]